MKDKCQRICLTPTRNEAWIIRPFLRAAQTWADHVIVADQGSTDGTVEEVQSTSGVKLVINQDSTYNEQARQRLLLEHARKVHGKRILIGLDADEAFSANFVASKEWERIGEAKAGTVLRFRWVNIFPGFKQAWIPPQHVPFGFVDDGSEHQGARIHSPRLPHPPGAPVLDLDETVVLHFQYVAWERMVSKHRWYQAWEHSKHEQQSPLSIFRQYHHMYGSWDAREIHPVKTGWLEGYDSEGIDFRSLQSEPVTWWDNEVLQMLRERGPHHFRKIALWDKDWSALARQLGVNGVDLGDPRSAWERAVHALLKMTQKRRSNLGVRGFEHLLRYSGW